VCIYKIKYLNIKQKKQFIIIKLILKISVILYIQN
jgi:hypothetical protein